MFKQEWNIQLFLDTINNHKFLLWGIGDTGFWKKKYTELSTSGSMGLSVGLSIPSIVNADIAKLYRLDKKCIPVYKDDWITAIQTAIDISYNDYINMVHKLRYFKHLCIQESIKNLASIIY